MEDYQLLAYSDVAGINSLDMVGVSGVPTLKIGTDNFNDIHSVRVNGVSTEFIVVSQGEILAEVPPSVRGVLLTRVDVLRESSGLSDTSIIRFEAQIPGARAKGHRLVVQHFLKVLLTRRGSDIFRPDMGGSLSNLIGSPSNASGLRAAVGLSIRRTEDQLVREQAASGRVSAEMLQSATLVDTSFNPREASINVTIRITTMDGTTSSTGVAV